MLFVNMHMSLPMSFGNCMGEVTSPATGTAGVMHGIVPCCVWMAIALDYVTFSSQSSLEVAPSWIQHVPHGVAPHPLPRVGALQ